MRVFTAGGVRVGVHWGVIPLLAVYAVFGELLTLLSAVLLLAVHEAAHALVAHRLGVTVHALTLYPFGAEARIDQSAMLPGKEGVIALAGPIVNLVMAGMIALFRRWYPPADALLTPFYRMNLMLAAFNLLPAYPLDGGRLLRSLLCRPLTVRVACRVTAFVSLAVACLLLAAAVTASLLRLPLWSLYVAGVFLLFASVREILHLPETQTASAVKRALAVQSGETVPVRFSAAHRSTKAMTALIDMRRAEYHVLRVVDDSMHFVGEIDENTLLAGIARLGGEATLGQIALLFDRGQKL